MALDPELQQLLEHLPAMPEGVPAMPEGVPDYPALRQAMAESVAPNLISGTG